MSTEQEIIAALTKAAEQLAGRSLTIAERFALVQNFEKSAGTPKERTRKALFESLKLNEKQITEKSAASDNTNRVMTDLDKVITNWKK